MSDPNETPAPKRRGLKIALALSLALNLAIVGLVGGAVLGARGGFGDGQRDGPPALRTLGLGPFVVALDREDRAALRGRIEAEADPLREERRAIGQALRAVQAALLSDPFDRGAAEAAFTQSRARVVSLQEVGHGALLDQIETMSPSERAALAENLNRVMRRYGGRR
ncbi:periplasmic heavy metal sensor [Gymnodinialimonas ulvae]|uniref:periplasmic heavy metal sensor n=1 Tax=Gymnodinialimonas ulvae TaxID=3126504 RepID=UPI0030A9E7CD